jgi:hypothetical protein
MLKLTVSSAGQSWSATAGVANYVGKSKIFKYITFSRAAASAMTEPRTL